MSRPMIEPDEETHPGLDRQAEHQERSKKTRRELETPVPTARGTAEAAWDLLRRKMMTPEQTRMKANNVPIFVRSASEPMSVNMATPPTTMPVQIVVICGVRNRG